MSPLNLRLKLAQEKAEAVRSYRDGVRLKDGAQAIGIVLASIC